MWIWLSGSNLKDQKGIYGELNKPTKETIPGSRSYGVSWVSTNDRGIFF
jgi:hypothetical protein